MRCRQVCRQHGEMESKLNHGSAGLGWNPWAGYSISLTSVSFFKVTKVLCDFFNSLEAHEEHRASGLLWNSIFTSLGALLSSALESAVQISVTSMRCLQRRDHILVTENKQCGYWWENLNRLISFGLKVFLPYTLLKPVVSS